MKALPEVAICAIVAEPAERTGYGVQLGRRLSFPRWAASVPALPEWFVGKLPG